MIFLPEKTLFRVFLSLMLYGKVMQLLMPQSRKLDILFLYLSGWSMFHKTLFLSFCMIFVFLNKKQQHGFPSQKKKKKKKGTLEAKLSSEIFTQELKMRNREPRSSGFNYMKKSYKKKKEIIGVLCFLFKQKTQFIANYLYFSGIKMSNN